MTFEGTEFSKQFWTIAAKSFVSVIEMLQKALQCQLDFFLSDAPFRILQCEAKTVPRLMMDY